MAESRPWHRFYGSVPVELEYPRATLYQALLETARRVPGVIAWDFFGTRSTYRRLIEEIDRCAGALAAQGLKPGDRIVISMPTSPPGVIAFYAATRVGAVPAMVHPLSTAHELTHYCDQTGARIAMTLDAFFGAMAAATPRKPLERIVVARIPDYLAPLKKVGFALTQGRRIPAVPADARVRWWKNLMAENLAPPPLPPTTADEPAAILFSGGTTGWPKGIVLSHRNLIAEGRAAASWCNLREGDAILAALPLFHGFGLGICVNAALLAGGKAILVPQFNARIVAERLKTDRPNIIVGVPTLYDALTRDASLRDVDLSCLAVCFSGADTLPREVKERFEQLVADRGGKARLLEGYGLTEAVSAVAATPVEAYREGSIGVPLPGMLAAICAPGTPDEVPAGAEGEICISGPAVMLGYLDDPEATRDALKVHADGRTWLHTGDLGRMDADGFLYFSVRLKRMIKSSGFNVYPAQVEAVLRQHNAVSDACVVGVPDAAQIERVVAYVVPGATVEAGPELEQALIAWCRDRLIKWSCPREVHFLGALPLTKVGKVDYRELGRRHQAARETQAA